MDVCCVDWQWQHFNKLMSERDDGVTEVWKMALAMQNNADVSLYIRHLCTDWSII